MASTGVPVDILETPGKIRIQADPCFEKGMTDKTPESGRNPRGSELDKAIYAPVTPLKFSLQLTPRRGLSEPSPNSSSKPNASRSGNKKGFRVCKSSSPSCCETSEQNGCSPKQCVTALLQQKEEEVNDLRMSLEAQTVVAANQLEAALLMSVSEQREDDEASLLRAENTRLKETVGSLKAEINTLADAITTVASMGESGAVDGEAGDWAKSLQAHNLVLVGSLRAAEADKEAAERKASNVELALESVRRREEALRRALSEADDTLARARTDFAEQEVALRASFQEAQRREEDAESRASSAEAEAQNLRVMLEQQSSQKEKDAEWSKHQREELERSFHAVKSALAISQASRDDVAKRHEEQVKALEEENERLRGRIASLEADVGEGQRAQLASEDAWEERSSRLTDRVSALTAELEATKSDRDAAIADAEEIAQRCEELEGELGVLYDVSKGLDGVSDRAVSRLEATTTRVNDEVETVERELQRLQEILSHNQAQQTNRMARYYLRQHGTPKTPKIAAARAVTPSSASTSRVSPLRTSYTGLLESEGASLPSRGASWAVGGKAAATPSQVQRWMESANMSVRDGKGEIASPSQVKRWVESKSSISPSVVNSARKQGGISRPSSAASTPRHASYSPSSSGVAAPPPTARGGAIIDQNLVMDDEFFIKLAEQQAQSQTPPLDRLAKSVSSILGWRPQ